MGGLLKVKLCLSGQLILTKRPPLFKSLYSISLSRTQVKLAIGMTPRGIRSPATVNRYMAALSHLFTIAYKEWCWLDENPFLKLSQLKEPRGRVRVLSNGQRNNLLASCQKSRSQALYPIVIICLSTGARKMEIAGLEKTEIDYNRKAIVLDDTKNGEQRVLYLGSYAWDQLMQAVEKSVSCSKIVFHSPDDISRPIDIRSAWETALQDAKIENFRFHDLRHCTASYLAMNGASLAEIAEILGHKTLSMVKRYTHLSESHTAKVLASMNQKIFGNEAYH